MRPRQLMMLNHAGLLLIFQTPASAGMKPIEAVYLRGAVEKLLKHPCLA